MDYPKSVPNVGLVNGKFADENSSTGQVGSLIPSGWGNAITDEVLTVIKAGGITPLEGSTSQLQEAIVVIADKSIEDQTQSSPTDATPGKLLAVGAFGLGGAGGGPIQLLNSAYVPGFYRYAASDPANPTPGSGGSFIVSVGGANYVQQIILTTPSTPSNPFLGVRSFDAVGNPGPTVSVYHSGNLGQATELSAGIQKVATQPLVDAGVDDATSISPKKLSAWFTAKFSQATEAVAGLVKIATNTQVNSGADDTVAITPLKLANKTVSSKTDTTAGKLLVTGYSGLGSSGDNPLVSLNSAFSAGFFRYAGSDPNAPNPGSAGALIVNSLGGNSVQQISITVPSVLYNPLITVRSFDSSGTPGPHVPLYHTGNIGTVDPWLMQPVGAVIALRDDLSATILPSTSGAYRYIKLSASDAYNSGVLTSESVSGAAPLIVATAVISFAGSPLNGKTVQLINTERRVLRAGLSGTAEQDSVQSHFHAENIGAPGTASNTADTIVSFAAGLSGAGAYNQRTSNATNVNNVAIGALITDSANGTIRTSNETRVKSVGVTYYMRIK